MERLTNRIVESSYKALRGGLPLPTKSGLCLMLTRLIVEDAHGLAPGGFYKLRTAVVDPDTRASEEPYARDMERSFRDLGLAVSQKYDGRYVKAATADVLPGDLLFRWDTAKDSNGVYVGHVGILLDGQMVLENVNPAYRSRSLNRGPTHLTPLWTWPVTTVVRTERPASGGR